MEFGSGHKTFYGQSSKEEADTLFKYSVCMYVDQYLNRSKNFNSQLHGSCSSDKQLLIDCVRFVCFTLLWRQLIYFALLVKRF